ncbi:MAG TPA: hypothetical protein VFP32_02600 [Candidatus Saccharimonadales bacterium]|nr:hypothetical protein [Candidatus Saccharimonadales bacterium]
MVNARKTENGKRKTAQPVEALVDRVARDYPQFKFVAGPHEHWSPRSHAITYNPSQPANDLRYGILHELSHALLGHHTYHSDFELLKLESDAWHLAAKIGRKYKIKIDDDHIQNCLDTYRDWLHRRSKCPTCGMHVMQTNSSDYKCFNCGTQWQVSSRRFSRAYRRQANSKKNA